MKNNIILSLGFLAVPIALCSQNHTNFILISMDDMGYGDLACNGALGYETPNIDALAHEGLRFTNFLTAQSVSSASRAALMTGCYPNRIGFYGALNAYSTHGINEKEETVAELLKKVDYATAIVGKWHLGHHEQFLPHHHGFDEYYGIPYSNDIWPVDVNGKPRTPVEGVKLPPPLPLQEGKQGSKAENKMIIRDLEDQAQLTRLFTERSLEFIKKNKENPFFLYLAHPMPHVPLAASRKFRGKSELGLYGDVMMEIDWSVGEILNILESLELEENTLIILTSDNGPWLRFGNHGGNSAGFREGKGDSWEGGVRVPCIMKWKGTIKEGTVTNKLASTIDILPTLCKLAGTSQPKQQIDGVDISSILRGEDKHPREEFYHYYYRNDLQAVRKGMWKLILPHTYRSNEGVVHRDNGYHGPDRKVELKEMELYDLRRDPGERYNVINSYPEKVKELLEVANKARADLGDDITNVTSYNRRPAGQL